MEALLRALAEPRRVRILRLLRKGERAAGEIADHFEVTRPAISQHLRVLSQAGLLQERRLGTKRLYRLRPQGLFALRRFLEQFWGVQLENLKQAVEEGEGKKVKRRR